MTWCTPELDENEAPSTEWKKVFVFFSILSLQESRHSDAAHYKRPVFCRDVLTRVNRANKRLWLMPSRHPRCWKSQGPSEKIAINSEPEKDFVTSILMAKEDPRRKLLDTPMNTSS
jgi:hypothetical protein